MTALIIQNQQDTANEVVLNPGDVTIGRSRDNDLTIKDATVSARHAKIVTFFDVSYIEDLHSTNGTYLNGKRITKHTLHDGDEIRLGKQCLTFKK